MQYNWEYNAINYETEVEANQAVSDVKQRLANNPTDWVTVKEVQASPTGWLIPPDSLSDVEINALDAAKTYTLYSTFEGGNYVPLTSSETATKVSGYRADYVRLRSLEFMTKFDVNYTMALDGTVTPEPEIIPVDLSGYVP
tara:strand:+ start:987 stop:1409 length:423 start_codon:yes stop_codon:yes gene_type:complete